jgi:lysophospholipase L1-like esterase
MRRTSRSSGGLNWNCIAFMGDSMTIRPNAADCYPTVVGADRNFGIVVNAGVDGDTTDDMIARFDSAILAHRPAAVAIMCGTNDCILGPSWLDDFEAYVREMISRAQDLGIRVTLCTPPIRRDAEDLESYVEVLREIAGDTAGVILFDVFAQFETYNSGQLDTFYDDDVHLNAAGNLEILALAQEVGNADAFTTPAG